MSRIALPTTQPTTLARDVEALGPAETETATFGMGCFWGPDALFGAKPGVVRTRVGYAGGTTSEPTYYALGDHTEVVQIEYDPDRWTYAELLDVVWANHDWTRSQKRQYRGVILAHDERQRAVAERSRDALADRTGQSVETAVESLQQFSPAEDYHQKYELRTLPVVADELEELYGDAFTASTVAARLNGFAAGYGSEGQQRDLLATLDLPPTVLDEVRRRL
ncbi:peptide-methionine (S)-S-oxide reductase [Halorhabdus sp. CBA1104]|uniref:peptide-methionine (S)-S-oxide reductase MsrA n=1 Tax=Halorhabdus sp. CBA1104 TaxID=1380432 RepID=UPI0012B3B8E6|nr:peptide-methionine (S)-S-oxide reductase MsrA [Halorhabdus sp. CBA1104]QGN07494.1 peptide-methionine (S)-S-oxide reductase [Halorhabdus sp. CBA1104]